MQIAYKNPSHEVRGPGVIYISVIEIRLIPCRELNNVIKTKKAKRPSGELIKIS